MDRYAENYYLFLNNNEKQIMHYKDDITGYLQFPFLWKKGLSYSQAPVQKMSKPKTVW